MEPVLKAVDMADPNVEHLGVMAYAAYFQWVKARPKPCDRLKIIPDGKTVRVHNPVRKHYTILIKTWILTFQDSVCEKSKGGLGECFINRVKKYIGYAG